MLSSSLIRMNFHYYFSCDNRFLFDNDSESLFLLLVVNSYYYFCYSYFHVGNQGGSLIEADPSLDLAGNFAHMLGYNNDNNEVNEGMKELMRLYLTIHADHEGGR